MEIKNLKIEDLKPAIYNPRYMDENELEKLKNSLKEFGAVEPLVVNKDMTVIGGHQRLKAAEALGWTEIPCQIVDLDKKREKLLNLALNRIIGSWDETKLAKLVRNVKDYPDVKLSGLDESELEMLDMQYELIFGDQEQETANEEAVKKMFELDKRVPVDIERPQVAKKESKVAFYTDNFEDWKKITDHFKTNKKSELDTQKLLKAIE